MENKIYALGMGDTEYLSAGVFATENEAHDAAAALRHNQHDNGDFYSEYTIGKVSSSVDLAKAAMNGLAIQTAEFFAEIMGEVESFGNEDGDVIAINKEGISKLEESLVNILENHTDYPRNQAIGCSVLFKFDDDANRPINCISCNTAQSVPLSLNQQKGLNEYASFTCLNCKGVISTHYNSANDTLAADFPRI